MIRLELLVGNKMIFSKVEDIHSIVATKRRMVKEAMEIIGEKNSIVKTVDKYYKETQKALMKNIYETYVEYEKSNYTYIYVEPVKKRKSNKIKLNVRKTDGSIVEVEAKLYKTKVEAFKKYNLYIYKNSNNTWILVEAITGTTVCFSLKYKKIIEDILENNTNITKGMDKKMAELYKKFGNTNPHLVDGLEEEKEVKKSEIKVKTNKDTIINKLKKENITLDIYDNKIDKLNKKDLQKILDRLPDGGDIQVKINKKIHIVEIDIDIMTNEVDFNVLTKEEYVSRYGNEFFES